MGPRPVYTRSTPGVPTADRYRVSHPKGSTMDLIEALTGELVIDMTNGPNPIMAHLIARWPDGHVREVWGLGNREHLVEPTAVHDPKPPAAIPPSLVDEAFPFRASRAARSAGGPDFGRSTLHDVAPGETFVNPVTREALTAYVSATPTGSINLQLRKQLDQ